MIEGRGPIFLEIYQPLQKGWEDPAGSTDHLTPDGKRKQKKRGPIDVNWDYNESDKRANEIIHDGTPERGPNADNIDERNRRREESRDR